MRVTNIFAGKGVVAVFFGALLLISACDVINPADPIPAYIRVDEITVDPVTGTGTTAQQFEEVWVYVNGTFTGAYSLGNDIPLLNAGPTELLIFPGIRINGIRSVADFYPFFLPLEQTVDLVPGETRVLDMHTQYRSNVAIPWVEDFETAHNLTGEVDGDIATYVVRETTDVFEGNASGQIALTADADFIQVSSVPLLTELPTDGSPVYLELHYKNDVDFAIGLIGYGQGIEPSQATILVLRPQADWYKVYVDLSPALNASQLDAYQLVFTAAHDTTRAQSNVFLDNLKLVHIDR